MKLKRRGIINPAEFYLGGKNKKEALKRAIKDLTDFYYGKYITKIIDSIQENILAYRFEEVYEELDKIYGIGKKIGRYIIRRLTLVISELGGSYIIDKWDDRIKFEYALPIDRHVKYVFTRILGVTAKYQDIPAELVKISKKNKVNPLYLNYGMHLFGLFKLTKRI